MAARLPRFAPEACFEEWHARSLRGDALKRVSQANRVSVPRGSAPNQFRLPTIVRRSEAPFGRCERTATLQRHADFAMPAAATVAQQTQSGVWDGCLEKGASVSPACSLGSVVSFKQLLIVKLCLI